MEDGSQRGMDDTSRAVLRRLASAGGRGAVAEGGGSLLAVSQAWRVEGSTGQAEGNAVSSALVARDELNGHTILYRQQEGVPTCAADQDQNRSELKLKFLPKLHVATSIRNIPSSRFVRCPLAAW